SVANTVLLNPFPYPDHSRIYYVCQDFPKLSVRERYAVSVPDIIQLAQRKIYDQIAVVDRTVSRNLTAGLEPERVSAARGSGDFFSLLGVNPLLGRTINAADQGPRGERVLVINHGLWQRRFGANPGVIGQKVFLDDGPYTIVGVMPANFFYYDRDVWFPFSDDLKEFSRQMQGFVVLVRLKPGV